MKKIIYMFVASLFLIGCSSTDKTTCVIEYKDEGKMVTTNTMIYKGDKVSTFEIENIIKLNDNKVFTKEMLVDYAESIKVHYDELDGVTYSFESTDKEFKEEIILDLNEKTIEGIRESGAVGKYIDTENENLSAKKMIKMLEADGQTCK